MLLIRPANRTNSMPADFRNTKPMEDLWPFLDREEFESNMILNVFG